MHQGFFQRLVGILVLNVLADNANPDYIFRVVHAADQFLPLRQIAIFCLQVQIPHGERVHAFMRENDWHFVDRGHVFGCDDGLFFHVAEERNLRLDLFCQEAVGAAQQNVRLNADAQQFLYRVLGRLGFQFLRGGDKRHQRDVHE